MYDFEKVLPLKRKTINLKGLEKDMKTYTVDYKAPKNQSVSDICYRLYKDYSAEDLLYYLNFIVGFVPENESIKVVSPKYLKVFKERFGNGFGYSFWL